MSNQDQAALYGCDVCGFVYCRGGECHYCGRNWSGRGSHPTRLLNPPTDRAVEPSEPPTASRQPAEGQSEAERASVYGCAPEDVQSGPRMMHGNLKYHFPYTYHPHAPHPETRECEARACQPVAAKPPRMMQGPRAQDGGWYKDHAGVHAYSPDCDEKPACQPVAPKPGKRRLDDAEFQRIASAYVSGFAESARASCVGLSPGPRKHVWAGIRALLKELGYEKGEL